ncbi:uncharacterized protein LOC109707117 isoform X3 [Ananas comosus]|uniref:Uncharacterized protein LOC109707117 isoform X3 n=1 Tax=Ananas comosus TaxID=4615 RepID=A0A6P5EK67_ANACO|nr:uncharacterized protein LOC109707117 isoform X3 [Ananas comosus]
MPQPPPSQLDATPPRPPRKMAAVRSITREQIDSFWRRKKMDEEEHLLAAQKAAARIRAKSLREDDYHRFQALLKEIIIDGNNNSDKEGKEDDVANDKESRIGIKDWWTKSKYAYLNQPSIKSMDDKPLKQNSTYIPQKACFNTTSFRVV